jgi:hypothetical protein
MGRHREKRGPGHEADPVVPAIVHQPGARTYGGRKCQNDRKKEKERRRRAEQAALNLGVGQGDLLEIFFDEQCVFRFSVSTPGDLRAWMLAR